MLQIFKKSLILGLSICLIIPVAEAKGARGNSSNIKINKIITKKSNEQMAKKISKVISSGHALKKHSREFEKVKQAPPNIKQKLLQKITSNTIKSGQIRKLQEGRIIYGVPKKSPHKKIVVIYDPNHKDKGTVMKPTSKTYFNRQKGRQKTNKQ